jgi:hypothetical protein
MDNVPSMGKESLDWLAVRNLIAQCYSPHIDTHEMRLMFPIFSKPPQAPRPTTLSMVSAGVLSKEEVSKRAILLIGRGALLTL